MRIACALKGVPLRCIDAMALPRDEWLAINPQGLMPAAIIGGRAVPQATAILEWLEETYPAPPLLPADAVLRAEARAFAQIVTAEIHAICVQRLRNRLAERHGADEAAQSDWVHHWSGLGYAAMEAMLAQRGATGPWCFGAAPGWAELHLVPQWRASLRLGCDLSPYPRLAAAVAAADALPAFRTDPPDFADAQP